MGSFNWNIVVQILSYVIPVVSIIVSFLNNRKNNNTVKEIELTKQEFAKENEQLKRQENLQDEKNKLIANFLGSIATYQATHSLEALKKAVKSCGEVIPACNQFQRKLVTNTINAINDTSGFHPSQEAYDNCNRIISEVIAKFTSIAALSKS